MAKKNQTTTTAAAVEADTAPVDKTATKPALEPEAVVFPGQVPPTDEVGTQITPEERAALGEAGVVSEAGLGAETTVIAATPEGTPGADRAEVAIITTPGAVEQDAASDSELLAGPKKGGKSKKALVLRDSAYGKCGQVRDFDAALVEGLEKAGLIDSHPAAVQAAEG